MALTPQQIEDLRSVIAGLDGVQSEVAAAVKRKAAEPMSNFQLRLINGVLAKANALLGKGKPVHDFVQFDSDDLPTAADVSMIVSQYVEALEQVRCSHIHKLSNGAWVWTNSGNIHTVAPRARK